MNLAVTEHAMKTRHNINWKDIKVLSLCKRKSKRCALESWFIEMLDLRMNRDQGTLSSDYDCRMKRDQGTLSSDYDCRMNRDQGTLSSDYDCRMNRDQGTLSSDYDCLVRKSESIRTANSQLTQLFLPQDNCIYIQPLAQTCSFFFVYSLGITKTYTIILVPRHYLTYASTL